MDNQTNNVPTHKNSLSTLAGIGAIAVVLIGGYLTFSKSSSKSTSVQEQKSVSTVTSLQTKKTGAIYKDGSYSVEGDYMVHVGKKHIGVKITLKNDTITDSEVTNEADDPMSVRMQNVFIAGYKELVVGKKIDEVHLTKVSGSSLTPIGFNDALKKVMDQAKI